MSKTRLPVHEVFHTWQGEGVHMGRPAFFIRLYGCPVTCPWCDSAGTWHKDHVPKDVRRWEPYQLRELAGESKAPIVVVTGGEPAIHDLHQLVEGFHLVSKDDYEPYLPQMHIETSGAFPIRGKFDWVTCSPKRWRLPVPEVSQIADEFKFIIETPDDIPFYTDLIIRTRRNPLIPMWLHPEWSKREDPAVMQAISEAVKGNKHPYRAGYQLHKLYKVDSLDDRSRPLVPLGGDLARGF